MPRKDLIQVRRDTSSNWSSVNPVLASGEIGFETNTNKIKVGDGVKPWNLLPYGSGAVTISDNAPTSPTAGDQWYESDSGKLFVYYDSFWVEVIGGVGGQQGPTGPTGPVGVAGPTSDITFTIPGTLTTGAKNVRFYVEASRTISNVVASVSTAPTGASVIFDVNKNGTTIFTTQANRPTIAASGFYDGSSVPDVASLSAGDYLTIDVDQVGSTLPGDNAVIRVVFS